MCAQGTELWLLFCITSPPWDIQSEFLLEALNKYMSKTMAVPMHALHGGRHTLGYSGVKFGLSDIKYEKKCCPFTLAGHGSFSVLQSGLFCLEILYLLKAIAMGPASDSGNCLLKLG